MMKQEGQYDPMTLDQIEILQILCLNVENLMIKCFAAISFLIF